MQYFNTVFHYFSDRRCERRLCHLFPLIVVCLTNVLPMQAAPIKLFVDASEIVHHVFHVRMTIPTAQGPATLVYPEWIPGEHSPVGPINDIAGLRFTAEGIDVPWQRDAVDMYAFHLQVPPNASDLEVQFDVLCTSDGSDYLLGSAAALQQMVLNWNQVVLYPFGSPSDHLIIEVQLTLPAGWKFATALPVRGEEGQVIAFKPVTLTRLVDSPLLAGTLLREIDITPPGEAREHKLDIAAESGAALDIPEEVILSYRQLVAETGALFKARHYDNYRFLVWLHGADLDGLEHHESSDIRLPERALVDAQWRRMRSDLMPHEMVHSWNGKYRRPIGLATPDYQQPMQGDLLWVYEGLAMYLGEVLAVRSGLWADDEYRDMLADHAAKLDNRPGRTWRSLQDTATAAQILYGSSLQWSAARRSGDFPDFYHEGSLLWLDVDTLIRDLSKGTKSLDDFCSEFFGGKSGSPMVVPYTFEDVVTGLNQIVPFDWRGFLRTRLDSLSPHADLRGIETAGWRLTYTDQPSELSKALESQRGQLDMRYSIGAFMETNGSVVDVIPKSPAASAGLVPGMKVVAVNAHRFSPQVLRDGLREGKIRSAPLELLVSNQDDFLTLRINYYGGERYPRLERDVSKPDLLRRILAPLSPLR